MLLVHDLRKEASLRAEAAAQVLAHPQKIVQRDFEAEVRVLLASFQKFDAGSRIRMVARKQLV